MENLLLDMSVGNPEFLQPYWNENDFPFLLEINKDNNYCYGSLEQLKNNIKQLHKKLSNADVTDCEVVIGNGVTQLLNGLIYLHSSPLIYAESPCYHRFFKFAELNNKKWIKHEHGLTIVTLPNNPDANYYFSSNKSVIYDLNYNWPQYTKPQNYNFDVMVFGFAKGFGFASSRIGWALIKDKQLAENLKEYVELTSGGVSIQSQKLATRVIEREISRKENVFSYGKKILEDRWQTIWYNTKLPFELLNGRGMYLWCMGECPKQLKGVSGELMGVSSEYFRLNLGCSEETWNKFKEIYAK